MESESCRCIGTGTAVKSKISGYASGIGTSGHLTHSLFHSFCGRGARSVTTTQLQGHPAKTKHIGRHKPRAYSEKCKAYRQAPCISSLSKKCQQKCG